MILLLGVFLPRARLVRGREVVELQHRAVIPTELVQYLQTHPTPAVADFDSLDFSAAKRAVKKTVHEDQGGLCVYCERPFPVDAGHVEHIKPKGGDYARPELCFSYENFAFSCNTSRTCGHRKQSRLLPIEPSVGCNTDLALSTLDASIGPRDGVSKVRKQQVIETLGMLGLNIDPALMRERKKWLDLVLTVLKEEPEVASGLLHDAPFRYILATVL